MRLDTVLEKDAAWLPVTADRHLSASSQSQALNGIVFLYQQLLEQPFHWLERLDRPKRAQRLPSVLSMQQVRQILARMQGIELLTAQLIYGTGMRIGECMSLRIKDINGAEGTIPTRTSAPGPQDHHSPDCPATRWSHPTRAPPPPASAPIEPCWDRVDDRHDRVPPPRPGLAHACVSTSYAKAAVSRSQPRRPRAARPCGCGAAYPVRSWP